MQYYNWQDNLKKDIKEFMESSSQTMDLMIRPSAERNFIKYLHDECPEVTNYKVGFDICYNAILIRICKKEVEM